MRKSFVLAVALLAGCGGYGTGGGVLRTSPSTISRFGSSTLSWDLPDGARVAFSNFDADEDEGSLTVRPLITTQFWLTARLRDGNTRNYAVIVTVR